MKYSPEEGIVRSLCLRNDGKLLGSMKCFKGSVQFVPALHKTSVLTDVVKCRSAHIVTGGCFLNSRNFPIYHGIHAKFDQGRW